MPRSLNLNLNIRYIKMYLFKWREWSGRWGRTFLDRGYGTYLGSEMGMLEQFQYGEHRLWAGNCNGWGSETHLLTDWLPICIDLDWIVWGVKASFQTRKRPNLAFEEASLWCVQETWGRTVTVDSGKDTVQASTKLETNRRANAFFVEQPSGTF